MNEEEVKARIVLPWLERRGVLLSELRLETSFSIRIGRQTIPVGSLVPAEQAKSARLDILVSRGERNLVVIETKRADLSLTDDDRDQVVSYARLVHPVAPYALVTNGAQSRLFNSITREPVQEESIDLCGDYEISLPENDRDAAIRLFFSCSPTNLLVFSRTQIASQLAVVSGHPGELGARYLPDVQVPRANLTTRLNKFMASGAAAFVVVGNSGIGKTCSMCDAVQHLSRHNVPVLFFFATTLEGGLLNAVASEFEWTFKEAVTPIALLARLSSLSPGVPIVLVVDAIDEWSYGPRVQHLSDVVRHVDPTTLRLMISSKTSTWPLFCELRGTTTGVLNHVYRKDPEPYSHSLEALEPEEFHEAIAKYREAYGVTAKFEERVFAEARRNPFLLRILFEVAKATGASYLTFSSGDFFELYLSEFTKKTGAPSAAYHVLTEAAEIVWATNAEWIDERELAARCGIRPGDTVLEELIAAGGLNRVSSSVGFSIAFGFGQLRDYLVSHRVRRWPTMDPEKFAEDVDGITFPSVRAEALSFCLFRV